MKASPASVIGAVSAVGATRVSDVGTLIPRNGRVASARASATSPASNGATTLAGVRADIPDVARNPKRDQCGTDVIADPTSSWSILQPESVHSFVGEEHDRDIGCCCRH